MPAPSFSPSRGPSLAPPARRASATRLATLSGRCLGIALAGALLASPLAAETFWVRTADADSAHSLQPSAVVDYGTFTWAEVEAASADELTARFGDRLTAPPRSVALDLGGQRFDPVVTPATARLAPAWRHATSPAGPALRLVQSNGPLRPGALDAYRAAGLEPIQYIHPHTYVVWGTAAALAQVEIDARVGGDGAEATSRVRWTGDFEPAYRMLPAYRALEQTDWRALVYRPAGLESTLDAFAAIGATVTGQRGIDHRFVSVSLELPVASRAEAAAIAGVYTLQPVPHDGGLRSERSNQINVGNYDGSNFAFPGYGAWLATAGVTGAGVRMANVDGGIYDTHPDLVARMVGCTGSTCGGSATDGHGTHTAAIMAGDGASGTVDADGFLRGLGVAPGAELVEQLYSPTFTQPGGMLTLMRDSFANGAVLSGNSWGPAGSPRGYDDDTLQVDIGVRDARTTIAGNQSFSYVLSFMNGNGGTSSQGTPDEAKNLFTIGSTKMLVGANNQDPDIDDLSANSAHGPALDGRRIPHMVAPGCLVDSAISASGYGRLCGTSMASPHVSGAVGLYFEQRRAQGYGDPSPAMVKAAFLAAARDLAGNRDADGGVLGHRFDSKQGWGRMDLDAVIRPNLAVATFDDPTVFDATGEEWSVEVTAEDPTEPVRILLAWTDAPGHGIGGSTPAWNNDLDLEVEADGATYRGNQFGGDGWSTPGGTAEGRDNTEGVFLEQVAGSFTVRVVAADINSDGIPGEGDSTDQDFALACYNCFTGSAAIFADDFEGGDFGSWSSNSVLIQP